MGVPNGGHSCLITGALWAILAILILVFLAPSLCSSSSSRSSAAEKTVISTCTKLNRDVATDDDAAAKAMRAEIEELKERIAQLEKQRTALLRQCEEKEHTAVATCSPVAHSGKADREEARLDVEPTLLTDQQPLLTPAPHRRDRERDVEYTNIGPHKLPRYTRLWGYWSNDPIAALVGIPILHEEFQSPPKQPSFTEPAVTWPLMLQRCRLHVVAQGKQDGILLCIFAAIGHTNRYFVEFGHTSFWESNSGLLYILGWRGLFLDGDRRDATYNAHKAYLTPTTICSTLRKHKVPPAFDYLSADLDSIELYVVHAILRCGFRPRVFSIEYNCHVTLDRNWTVDIRTFKGWKGGCYYGLSLGAAVALAERWGYALVAVDVLLDAFFVDRALLPAGVQLPSLSSFQNKLCLARALHRCPPGTIAKERGWIEAADAFAIVDSSGGEEQLQPQPASLASERESGSLQ